MNEVKNITKKSIKIKIDQKIIYSLISILIGIFIGMFLMSILGYNPLVLITSLFKGTFSNLTNFGNFISVFTWVTFVGLSMMVAFKAGLFNIGISAQMVGGGLAGYLFAALVNSTSKIGMLASILIPIFVGISIALLIAFLKNKFKIHEVISSIMLNWSIYWVYKYFSNPINAPYLFNGGTSPKAIYSQNSLRVDWLTSLFPDSTINIAIIILIVVLPSIYFLYKKTNFGIKQNIIGNNKDASFYTGINIEKEIYKSMSISGALAGMAGAAFYLGTNQSLVNVSNDLSLEPFTGITVALIGFNNPVGIIFSSIFIALFENANVYLTIYSNDQISKIIPAIIILILSTSSYFIMYEPHKKIIKWLNEKENLSDEFENKINNIKLEITKMKTKLNLEIEKNNLNNYNDNITTEKQSKLNKLIEKTNNYEKLKKDKILNLIKLRNEKINKLQEEIKNMEKLISNYEKQIKNQTIIEKQNKLDKLINVTNEKIKDTKTKILILEKNKNKSIKQEESYGE